MENETTLKLPPIVGERKSMLWTPKIVVENSIGRDENAVKTMMLERKNFASYNNSMVWSEGDILVNMEIWNGFPDEALPWVRMIFRKLR